MKTYITEILGSDGNRYEGPRINAASWGEAQSQASTMGVILLGELG